MKIEELLDGVLKTFESEIKATVDDLNFEIEIAHREIKANQRRIRTKLALLAMMGKMARDYKREMNRPFPKLPKTYVGRDGKRHRLPKAPFPVVGVSTA